MFKRFTFFISLFLVVMVMSACGGGEQSVLDEIQEEGVITIATSGDNPPTIYPNENNELEGIDAEWAQIVADHLGVEIDWARMDFQGIIPSLTSEQAHIGMSGINVTEDRLEEIDFSEHYAYEDVIAIIPEDTTDINSPEDIEGKRVGVVAGSHNGEAPVQEIGGYDELTSYPSVSTALQDLKNERVDLVVTGRVVGGDWLQNEGDGYVMSEEGYSGTEIAIAIDQGNPELTEAINEAITQAKEDGKYEEIALEYVGTEFVE